MPVYPEKRILELRQKKNTPSEVEEALVENQEVEEALQSAEEIVGKKNWS